MLNETHALTDIHTDFIRSVGNVSVYIFSITSINPTSAIINMNSVTIFREGSVCTIAIRVAKEGLVL